MAEPTASSHQTELELLYERIDALEPSAPSAIAERIRALNHFFINHYLAQPELSTAGTATENDELVKADLERALQFDIRTYDLARLISRLPHLVEDDSRVVLEVGALGISGHHLGRYSRTTVTDIGKTGKEVPFLTSLRYSLMAADDIPGSREAYGIDPVYFGAVPGLVVAGSKIGPAIVGGGVLTIKPPVS